MPGLSISDLARGLYPRYQRQQAKADSIDNGLLPSDQACLMPCWFEKPLHSLLQLFMDTYGGRVVSKVMELDRGTVA
jgi:hypothetical protein